MSVGADLLAVGTVHARRFPDRLPAPTVVGSEQRVLVVGIGLQPRGMDLGRRAQIPFEAAARADDARQRRIPVAADRRATPSVTRSGRSVRVLTSGRASSQQVGVVRARATACARQKCDRQQQPYRRHCVATKARTDPACARERFRWFARRGRAGPRLRDHGGDAVERRQRPGDVLPSRLAPEEGFEPPTRRLTAACSATELLRNGTAHYVERRRSVKGGAWHPPPVAKAVGRQRRTRAALSK